MNIFHRMYCISVCVYVCEDLQPSQGKAFARAVSRKNRICGGWGHGMCMCSVPKWWTLRVGGRIRSRGGLTVHKSTPEPQSDFISATPFTGAT